MRVLRLLSLVGLLGVTACAERTTPLSPGEMSRIVSGTPDAGRHPYVGLLIFEDVGGSLWLCSGSLLSPTVVLTAAHCTDGAVDARIWFAESLVGNPEFPFGGATSYEGTAHTYPEYCVLCTYAAPGLIMGDIGIVVLEEPVPVGEVGVYAQLPEVGIVDQLPNRTRIATVGYGVRQQVHGGGPPFWTAFGRRFYTESNLISGKFVNSDQLLRLSSNAAQGKGSSCYGDSGGPHLIAGTDVVVGVVSYGLEGNCRSVSYGSRIDTPESLAWIESFLD